MTARTDSNEHAASAASGLVTLVTGVPRSGTSLLMQMLEAGGHPLLVDGVRAADADNPRGYLEYEPVKTTLRDASWLASAAGRAVKVVHALVPSLPAATPGESAAGRRGYRVIWVRRSLAEVLASQRAMLARRGTPADSLPDQRAAAVLRGQLDALARWTDANAADALLTVEYASLIAEPLEGARELARFLGGSLDVDAMAAAVRPQLHRQRQRALLSGPT